MTKSNFIIRDGIVTDVENCLALDRTYETEYVWQMGMQEISGGYQVVFRKERLPRTMAVEYDITEQQLTAALAPRCCFLVACDRHKPQMYGFLLLMPDRANKIALVRRLVVGEAFRRRGIATRLLNVACRWADEQDLTELMLETQTKNYPSIQFCLDYGLSFCGYNDQYFRNQDIAVFFGQTLRS